GVVRTESEIFCTVHQKDRGFRSFGLVSVNFFFVAFWFSYHQVRQISHYFHKFRRFSGYFTLQLFFGYASF
ncbi:hypothetical protein, partial [Aliivibrio finisterrensis]|uniref:hypothetical protein n=1 Tax=Aliivibrio finisterrensis TaxID=511998 RepID=UPI001AD606BE